MIDLRPDDQVRLTRVFRYLDELAPPSPELPVVASSRRGLRRRPVFVSVLALVATLIAFVPVVLLTGGGESPATTPETTAPVSPPTVPPTIGSSPAPELLSIAEVEADGPPYPFDSRPPQERLPELLDSTDTNYDPAHDAIDGVIFDDRAVIVEGGTVGISYSDGGTWTPALISFPPGMAIDDYWLPDGIQNIETDGQRLIAWESAQLIDGPNEPMTENAGTLVLESTDGANWTARVVDEDISALLPWRDGYLAAIGEPSDQLPGSSDTSLVWSTDLTQWTNLTRIGIGWVGAIELAPGGVRVWFEDHSMPELPGEDGNPHPEDAPINPFLKAFLVELS